MRPLIQFVRKLIKKNFFHLHSLYFTYEMYSRCIDGVRKKHEGRKNKTYILIVVFYACKLSNETVSIMEVSLFLTFSIRA